MKKINLVNLFLLTIFCSPFYLIKVSIFNIPSNVLELLALSAILLTIIKERAFFLKKLFSLPVQLLLGSFLIITGLLLSLFFNNNALVGFGIIKGWFLIPMFFSFSFYVTLKSKLDVEKILLSLYLSSTVIAFIGLAYKITNLMTYDNRLNAFYSSPNQLAMYLAPGIVFGVYFFTKTLQQRKLTRELLCHFVLLSILILTLYWTYSYGTWLSLFVTLATIILIRISSKKQLFLSLSTIFLFFVTLIVLQLNTEKFSTLTSMSERSSFASRQMIWKVSSLLISENPLVGIGPGNFQVAYLAMQPKFEPYLEWAVPHPHNIFLAFWLQAGLLGFVGFLLLLFFVFQLLWQLFRHKKNVSLLTPLFAFFLYTLLHGMLDTTYWKNDLAFMFWICLFATLFIFQNNKNDSY